MVERIFERSLCRNHSLLLLLACAAAAARYSDSKLLSATSFATTVAAVSIALAALALELRSKRGEEFSTGRETKRELVADEHATLKTTRELGYVVALEEQ